MDFQRRPQMLKPWIFEIRSQMLKPGILDIRWGMLKPRSLKSDLRCYSPESSSGMLKPRSLKCDLRCQHSRPQGLRLPLIPTPRHPISLNSCNQASDFPKFPPPIPAPRPPTSLNSWPQVPKSAKMTKENAKMTKEMLK